MNVNLNLSFFKISIIFVSVLIYHRLIGLAFSASVGLMLVVLACALPTFQVWWPMFVLVFYVLSPIPLLIAARIGDTDALSGSSNAIKETCLFITTGIVVSAYGLPFILCRVGTIEVVPAILTMAGNTWCFITILIFFMIFNRDDDFDFHMW
ncbi:putative leptin receptor gene-related protein isoform X3 [Apostichopus japonicus]|uniref:Putative leptin receptor gene-related protein isoform X3 n=1 Tax=Stichopus japonicus TaxID=307972 RepID=A0A2G8KMA2_STIJA|nr:putative leptin receptor gene-related protein isoform X3 [Apostichopus japonicus]